MRKHIFIGLFVLATLWLSPLALRAQDSGSMGVYKMARFLQLVANDYVDTIDFDKMVENAITEFLSQLDPHSIYISKDDVKAMNEPLEGNFEGIGVEFNIMNDTLMVVNPVPGGPAERVGVQAGDRIIAVDGTSIAGVEIKNADVYKHLRGPKGSKVLVTILRKGNSKTIDFTITRDKIPIHSLDASYMVQPKVGYIKLNRFALTTEKEFLDALSDLKKKGMQDLVLDLRGNGGGYLNAAVLLADHFLTARKLIVYTEGRTTPRTDFSSTSNGQFMKGRLIILVDEGSASASEIVAGAVQDWDRGFIVGRRSFGKGLVQNQIPLPDMSMIRLTVARYHTPTGRVIQRPYSSGNSENYYKELNDRLGRGELFNSDSIQFPDSLKYSTLIKKRNVYGGGGIMPDFFVPIDTSFYTPYYGRLVRSGALNQFVLNYVDGNRSQVLRKFNSFDKFNREFVVDAKMMNDFVAFAEKQGVPANPESLKVSEVELGLQLKALFAQSLFTTSHYFQVINQRNDALLQALKILQRWDDFKHMVQ